MALQFPDTPVLNELFTSGTLGWRWDGEKWTVPGITVAGPSGASGSAIIVTVTTALATGFAGFVWAEPASGPIAITMPPTPTAQQEIKIVNTSGNAAARNITVAGGTRTIAGAASVTLSVNYSWVDLVYTGAEWVQV